MSTLSPYFASTPGRWLRAILTALAALFLHALCAAGADTRTIVFDQPVSTQRWTLKEINPDLPADWTPYDYLVVEFRASSSQRFELGLQTATQLISKRIHPFPGVWVRASIPLRFYRQGLGNASELASTVNQPRDSYWINIEGGGNGPTDDVRGMTFTMRYPNGSPKLEIRSVTLSKTDPGDAVLDGKPLLDAFGQYTHADWPGKCLTEADLKKAWTAEAAALARAGPLPGRDQYGGFVSTQAKATGFFRVQQINGVWWFIDPDGHYFFSTGVNGVRPYAETRIAGREDYFASNPEPGRDYVSFYTENLKKRFGSNFYGSWAALTSERMMAWGVNTTSGKSVDDALGSGGRKIRTRAGWGDGITARW